MADIKCKLIEMKNKDIYDLDDFEDLEDLDNDTIEYIKNFKKSFSINTEIVNECKYLLNCLGIPYVDSYNEADSQCTSLSHYYKNIIPGVLSEDSDILIFGGHTLYRDFDFKNNQIKSININDILNYLQDKTNVICQTQFKKSLKSV